MPGKPLVTVLMAVHNDLRFLPDAVRSVLGQTLGEFELLVVDDACTDGSSDFLDALDDPRVRILRNEANLGLTRSLNIGLLRASAKYVARMDADDVCEPTRLQRQVEFLESNQAVGLLGTGRTLIDEAGNTVAPAPATVGRIAVLWKLLLGNPFAHASVMLRRDLLVQHGLSYDERFTTAQDYDLWVRMLQHTAGDNLAEPLLRYRLREGMSRTRKGEQLANHDRIAFRAVSSYLPELELSEQDVRELRGRFGGFSVREGDMNPADARWRATRAAMLEAFVRRYGPDAGVAALVAAERENAGRAHERLAA